MKNHNHNDLDDQIYEKQVGICKAFANPTRLRILDLVAQHGYPASDLQERLSISKANLSQHLAILKSAGVVTTRREGKRVYCYLAIPEVKQACQLIRNVLRAQIRNGRQLTI
jgi:ArsR family transcriptional regulator, lead/cadmium/zinc/bismuth-responsive transcriptional repressor